MPLNGNSSVSQKRRWWGTGLSILGAVLIFAAFVTRRDDSIPVRIAHVQQGQIRSLISTNGKIEPVQNFAMEVGFDLLVFGALEGSDVGHEES